MLIFAAAIFFILITPGPGVLSLAGVGSAFGYRAGWTYGTGLFVGSNLVIIATALGLAAFLQANPSLELVFALASSGYLLYLAYRIASAGTRIAIDEPENTPGFWGAIMLQIFNPKAYAVGTFALSNFPIVPETPIWEIVIKLVILNAIWIPIHILWLWAGVSIRRLDLAPNTQRKVNIMMALAMVLVVGMATVTNYIRA